MMFRRLLAAACTALAALCASGTPQHKLATGLWIDPNESGWGLNLFHQGSTVFASLFVYGPDGQPRWYTASSMVNPDDGPIHDHVTTMVNGDLFESSGPSFGGPFDPSRVTRRKVGTMSIDLGNNITGVDYSIDGVHVSKQVVPFTFRRDDLSGDYIGYQWQPPKGEFSLGPEIRREVAIRITDSDSAFTLMTTESGMTCTYSGRRGQNRDRVNASGTYSCANGTSGNWDMLADVTPDGFMGSFNGGGIGSFWGRMGGARRDFGSMQGNGYRNDLWFPPNEGGWGVNILEQGDTIFATLFVYDAQGKSHWYSASSLHQNGPNADDGGFVYVGPLHESTGPYFGTAFNSSAVTRREVGSMDFQAKGDGTATLHYSVDGVNVMRTVNRFALQKNSLAGTYTGHIVSYAPTVLPEAVNIVVDDSGNPVVMDTNSFRGTCRYTSPMAQVGELRRLSGTFSCSDGRTGSYVMDNVVVNWEGFTASFTGSGINVGHIAGVRTQVN